MSEEIMIGGKDAVRCNNCMRVCLVEMGDEKCPNCGFEGGLQWASKEEVEKADFN